MLLRITNYCGLACKHCFISANTKGAHMPWEVFVDSIECVNRTQAQVLLISGGEPTDHPEYFRMLDWAIQRFAGKAIVVITNGMWTKEDENLDKYAGKYPQITFQVTNDKKYYNKLLDKKRAAMIERKYTNVAHVWEISDKIFPQGRARSYMKITEENTNSRGSRCFNLRSILNQQLTPTLSAGVAMLESMGRFCTPSINIEGTLVGGESNDCPTETGNVLMSDSALGEAMKRSSCNDCGMLTSLSPAHQAAVNFIPTVSI